MLRGLVSVALETQVSTGSSSVGTSGLGLACGAPRSETPRCHEGRPVSRRHAEVEVRRCCSVRFPPDGH